ncbi:hypothetical protein ACFY1P_08035 [Streptomyces sp. NPDC001407]|uniref:hypothetical protein n=1 Tax=Streptomyces sp. NPDC001407 TaxID=3364573 RepID=UPI0036CCBF51
MIQGELFSMIVHHSDCVMCHKKGKEGVPSVEAIPFRGKLFPFCADHADQLFAMLDITPKDGNT